MTPARARAAGRAAALALAVALSASIPADAYLKLGVQVGAQQVSLKWSRLPIRYFLSDQDLPGLSLADFNAAVVRAFGTWQAVSSSAVMFQGAGITSARPADQDGATTIGFVARPDMDRVLGATSFVVDTTTGDIVEAGIFLNSVFPWSTSAAGGTPHYDVESIALHEIGHLVGLGHSAIGETELRAGGRRVIATGAAMFPIAFSAGSILGRDLKADDAAGVSEIYPESATQAGTGSLNGRVTKDGSGVFGAHIVAFNPATGVMIGGFALTEGGDFVIAGLAPGSYVVRAEPLDDADLTSFFPEGVRVDVGFRATYLEQLAVVPRGGNAGPFEIKVAAR